MFNGVFPLGPRGDCINHKQLSNFAESPGGDEGGGHRYAFDAGRMFNY